MDYGAWECSSCNIPNQGQPGNSADLAEIAAFIYAHNPEIHDSKNETVHRWINNSTITICDLDSCLQVIYSTGRGSISWLPTTGPTARGNRQVKVPQAPEAYQPLVSVSPVGPDEDNYHGEYSIELPYFQVEPRRGSVEVIQYPDSTVYIGDTDLMPIELEPEIGYYLDWNPDSSGLCDYWSGCW